MMEKYLVSMNLPSRAQMVGMAERIQGIEAQLNEIKAMLHQIHHNSAAPEGGYGTSRPPRTKRPPSEGEQKMNAPAGLDPTSIPERIQSEVQARDPAQHQGRRIHLLIGPRAGLDAKGRTDQPVAR